ncbi:MAG: hypothetical protein KAG56_10945 [Sulfurovaceae bacterium]|nr:hypothetical protein [Sulfurovaceae bacterium]
MEILILAISIIMATGVLFLYFLKKNNKDRKENLNIIKDDNILKFYLSDDIFFSIDLDKNTKFTHILLRTIRNEISSLKTTVRKISLINIEDEALENRLNRMLKKAQEKG